jgi:hypothetical protein
VDSDESQISMKNKLLKKKPAAKLGQKPKNTAKK